MIRGASPPGLVSCLIRPSLNFGAAPQTPTAAAGDDPAGSLAPEARLPAESRRGVVGRSPPLHTTAMWSRIKVSRTAWKYSGCAAYTVAAFRMISDNEGFFIHPA
jgi:hypothetical protein